MSNRLETRAERLTRRRRAIRNVTWDAELAKKAQHWSDERILSELGIRVPKKTPALKPLPEKPVLRVRKTRAKLKLTKYQLLRANNFSVAEAKRYRTLSLERLQQLIILRRIPHAPPIPPRPPREPIHDDELKEIRKQQWSEWSRRKKDDPPKHPQWIIDLAETANKEQKLDINNNYGWAVAYEHYVNGRSLEFAKEMLAPDLSGDTKYLIVLKDIR